MGLLTQTRQLLLFTLWADRVMLDAARGVSPEHLTRDAGVSFGSMLGTLSHILGSQRRWLARFLGQQAAAGDPAFADFEALAAVPEVPVAALQQLRDAIVFQAP